MRKLCAVLFLIFFDNPVAPAQKRAEAAIIAAIERYDRYGAVRHLYEAFIRV